MMIVSKYFKTFDDFKNLQGISKKAYGNMGKFHYNPIPLNRKIRSFLPKLETLHACNNDDHFEDEGFYKRIIHYEVNYSEYLNRRNADTIYKTLF